MNRFVLDTHTLIWFLEGDTKISSTAKDIIIDSNNQIFVSQVSLWEMAIKISLNKLSLSYSLQQLLPKISSEGFSFLSIENTHILKVEHLSFHHRDPFDRLLIGQCIEENYPIITKDEKFKLYPQINVIW